MSWEVTRWRDSGRYLSLRSARPTLVAAPPHVSPAARRGRLAAPAPAPSPRSAGQSTGPPRHLPSTHRCASALGARDGSPSLQSARVASRYQGARVSGCLPLRQKDEGPRLRPLSCLKCSARMTYSKSSSASDQSASTAPLPASAMRLASAARALALIVRPPVGATSTVTRSAMPAT